MFQNHRKSPFYLRYHYSNTLIMFQIIAILLTICVTTTATLCPDLLSASHAAYIGQIQTRNGLKLETLSISPPIWRIQSFLTDIEIQQYLSQMDNEQGTPSLTTQTFPKIAADQEVFENFDELRRILTDLELEQEQCLHIVPKEVLKATFQDILDMPRLDDYGTEQLIKAMDINKDGRIQQDELIDKNNFKSSWSQVMIIATELAHDFPEQFSRFSTGYYNVQSSEKVKFRIASMLGVPNKVLDQWRTNHPLSQIQNATEARIQKWMIETQQTDNGLNKPNNTNNTNVPLEDDDNFNNKKITNKEHTYFKLLGESIQLVEYNKNGHYSCHHDSTDREDFHGLKKQQLERAYTVLFNLIDVDEDFGGQTWFPSSGMRKAAWGFEDPEWEDIEYSCQHRIGCPRDNSDSDTQGLVIQPIKGSAIIWMNHRARETEAREKGGPWGLEQNEWQPLDKSTLHSGCDLLVSKKIIGNHWVTKNAIEDLCQLNVHV